VTKEAVDTACREGGTPRRSSSTSTHEALINVAAKHDARMIVMGSHGESPLKGAIIGSTPSKLVQLSEKAGPGRQSLGSPAAGLQASAEQV